MYVHLRYTKYIKMIKIMLLFTLPSVLFPTVCKAKYVYFIENLLGMADILKLSSPFT